jgi:hypothetical protein
MFSLILTGLLAAEIMVLTGNFHSSRCENNLKSAKRIAHMTLHAVTAKKLSDRVTHALFFLGT